MHKFLHFSIGAFLLMAGVSLVLRSVQPAYAERQHISTAAPDARPMNILYVNIDTINYKYKPYIELSDSANSSLQAQMDAYQQLAEEMQNRYAKLQERVHMGTISVEHAAQEEYAINAGLEKLKLQEAELARFESEAMAKNDSISMDIAMYFDEYAIQHDVDYVLMYGTGMPIIYARDELDITDEVVTEMNARYDRDQAKKTEPARRKK